MTDKGAHSIAQCIQSHSLPQLTTLQLRSMETTHFSYRRQSIDFFLSWWFGRVVQAESACYLNYTGFRMYLFPMLFRLNREWYWLSRYHWSLSIVYYSSQLSFEVLDALSYSLKLFYNKIDNNIGDDGFNSLCLLYHKCPQLALTSLHVARILSLFRIMK